MALVLERNFVFDQNISTHFELHSRSTLILYLLIGGWSFRIVSSKLPRTTYYIQLTIAFSINHRNTPWNIYLNTHMYAAQTLSMINTLIWRKQINIFYRHFSCLWFTTLTIVLDIPNWIKSIPLSNGKYWQDIVSHPRFANQHRIKNKWSEGHCLSFSDWNTVNNNNKEKHRVYMYVCRRSLEVISTYRDDTPTP